MSAESQFHATGSHSNNRAEFARRTARASSCGAQPRTIWQTGGIGREHSEQLERQRMPGLIAHHGAIGAFRLGQADRAMVLLAGRERLQLLGAQRYVSAGHE
jgi:hypothetical protein